MTKRRLLAIAIIGLLGIGAPRIDRLGSIDDPGDDGRWQFFYDTALWTFVYDRTPKGPNEGTAWTLFVPDPYCYKHIGGYTGQVDFAFYSVPGDTNFVITALDGVWFGDGGCVSDWVWSTGKLERFNKGS